MVVDSDLAPDDLVALAYLLRHPDVRVLAITVPTTGLVTCPAGVDLVGDLMAAVRVPAVPVSCGHTARGRHGTPFPTLWSMGAMTDNGLTRDTEHTADAVAAPPPQLIARLATAHPGLTVVALGPMTELAATLASGAGGVRAPRRDRRDDRDRRRCVPAGRHRGVERRRRPRRPGRGARRPGAGHDRAARGGPARAPGRACAPRWSAASGCSRRHPRRGSGTSRPRATSPSVRPATTTTGTWTVELTGDAGRLHRAGDGPDTLVDRSGHRRARRGVPRRLHRPVTAALTSAGASPADAAPRPARSVPSPRGRRPRPPTPR